MFERLRKWHEAGHPESEVRIATSHLSTGVTKGCGCNRVDCPKCHSSTQEEVNYVNTRPEEGEQKVIVTTAKEEEECPHGEKFAHNCLSCLRELEKADAPHKESDEEVFDRKFCRKATPIDGYEVVLLLKDGVLPREIKDFIEETTERNFHLGVANGRQAEKSRIIELTKGMIEKDMSVAVQSEEWVEGWNAALSELISKLNQMRSKEKLYVDCSRCGDTIELMTGFRDYVDYLNGTLCLRCNKIRRFDEENYFKDSEGKIACHTSEGNMPIPEMIRFLLSQRERELREKIEKLADSELGDSQEDYDSKQAAFRSVLSLLSSPNEGK